MVTRKRRSGRTQLRAVALTASALVGSGLLAGCGSDGGIPVINVYGGTSQTGFGAIIDSCTQAAGGRYKIVGNLTPSDADSQREQFVRRLAAHDEGMDLLGTDVTWTAEFAEAGWIRELTGAQAEQAAADVLPGPLQTAKWKDKLYAIPKHTNVQLLFYRKSLVPTPPTTWDEAMAQAKELAGQGKPHQIGFTGAQYEGLVVGFNTILSSLGGTIVNADSTAVTIDDKTTKALETLQALATSPAASPSLSNSQEPEVFAQMQTGQSAFSLNWPYEYGSMKEANPDVYSDLAWTVLPSFAPGIPGRATLGGMNYTISSYSKHPDLAFEAAMCLRSPKNQLIHAQNGNEPPVLESLYNDPELMKAYPQSKEILEELKTAVPRPISPLYQNISTVISSTLSPPRDIAPDATTGKLHDGIQDALDGKGIVP